MLPFCAREYLAIRPFFNNFSGGKKFWHVRNKLRGQQVLSFRSKIRGERLKKNDEKDKEKEIR